ncbi:MAG: hypothetical protein HZA69_04330, partial [Gammaproteobacteria bacterium]|nr:hypothetical protein [Gammaproteobacteria bacterium]
MSADAPVILVPYGDDPLRHLATLLLERHKDRLPDLSQQVVLLPHSSAVPRFRRILWEQAALTGFSALLPPFTGTLTSWATRFANTDKRRLSTTAREILLLDLLHDYPQWRREYGDWPLADSLLELFDDLALHECRLPENSAGLIRQIAASHDAEIDDLSPFSDEAQLVHVLWGAWRERLGGNDLQDQTLQFTDGLARSAAQLASDTRVYLAGFVDFSRTEINWIKTLLARQCLTLLIHGSSNKDPENPATHLVSSLQASSHVIATRDTYADFLDRVFASGEDNLRQRAHKQAAASPTSPARGRLVLHQAADAESEARAIDLQVRRWLTQGLR